MNMLLGKQISSLQDEDENHYSNGLNQSPHNELNVLSSLFHLILISNIISSFDITLS